MRYETWLESVRIQLAALDVDVDAEIGKLFDLANGSPYQAHEIWPGYKEQLVAKLSSGRVVHCKREPYDVYIGRPSRWGNPFRIEKGVTREQAIEEYEIWLREQPDLMADIAHLHGLVLGCWCVPRPCHGEVLLKVAAEAVRAR